MCIRDRLSKILFKVELILQKESRKAKSWIVPVVRADSALHLQKILPIERYN